MASSHFETCNLRQEIHIHSDTDMIIEHHMEWSVLHGQHKDDYIASLVNLMLAPGLGKLANPSQDRVMI